MSDYRVEIIYKDGKTYRHPVDIVASNPQQAARKLLGGAERKFVVDPAKIATIRMTTPRSWKVPCRWQVDPVTYKVVKE